MIFRAIKYVAEVHEGHYRKGSKIPYIYHLTNVMKILHDYGCDQEVIIAGILHDAIEDTPATYEEIKRKFGRRVSDLVMSVTENDKSLAWQVRKQEKIDYLRNCNEIDVFMITAADKFDNLRSICNDIKKIGNKIWDRFNAPHDKKLWYYDEMLKILELKSEEFKNENLTKLTSEVARILNEIKKCDSCN
jgi:(p)ppGpp synthase/HD superfamily hydrolase